MNTEFLMTGVIIILIIGLIVLVRFKKQSTSDDIWPFYAKKPLMEIEQIFFHCLTRALPENIVLAQVQLSRFLGVKKGFSNWGWNMRIKRMSIDFLICRKDSSIIAAVELDDSADNQDKNHERDKNKNLAIKAAGIVVIRCDVRRIPTEKAIHELVMALDHPQSQDNQRKSVRRLRDRREVEFSDRNKLR